MHKSYYNPFGTRFENSFQTWNRPVLKGNSMNNFKNILKDHTDPQYWEHKRRGYDLSTRKHRRNSNVYDLRFDGAYVRKTSNQNLINLLTQKFTVPNLVPRRDSTGKIMYDNGKIIYDKRGTSEKTAYQVLTGVKRKTNSWDNMLSGLEIKFAELKAVRDQMVTPAQQHRRQALNHIMGKTNNLATQIKNITTMINRGDNPNRIMKYGNDIKNNHKILLQTVSAQTSKQQIKTKNDINNDVLAFSNDYKGSLAKNQAHIANNLGNIMQSLGLNGTVSDAFQATTGTDIDNDLTMQNNTLIINQQPNTKNFQVSNQALQRKILKNKQQQNFRNYFNDVNGIAINQKDIWDPTQNKTNKQIQQSIMANFKKMQGTIENNTLGWSATYNMNDHVPQQGFNNPDTPIPGFNSKIQQQIQQQISFQKQQQQIKKDTDDEKNKPAKDEPKTRPQQKPFPDNPLNRPNRPADIPFSFDTATKSIQAQNIKSGMTQQNVFDTIMNEDKPGRVFDTVQDQGFTGPDNFGDFSAGQHDLTVEANDVFNHNNNFNIGPVVNMRQEDPRRRQDVRPTGPKTKEEIEAKQEHEFKQADRGIEIETITEPKNELKIDPVMSELHTNLIQEDIKILEDIGKTSQIDDFPKDTKTELDDFFNENKGDDIDNANNALNDAMDLMNKMVVDLPDLPAEPQQKSIADVIDEIIPETNLTKINTGTDDVEANVEALMKNTSADVMDVRSLSATASPGPAQKMDEDDQKAVILPKTDETKTDETKTDEPQTLQTTETLDEVKLDELPYEQQMVDFKGVKVERQYALTALPPLHTFQQSNMRQQNVLDTIKEATEMMNMDNPKKPKDDSKQSGKYGDTDEEVIDLKIYTKRPQPYGWMRNMVSYPNLMNLKGNPINIDKPIGSNKQYRNYYKKYAKQRKNMLELEMFALYKFVAPALLQPVKLEMDKIFQKYRKGYEQWEAFYNYYKTTFELWGCNYYAKDYIFEMDGKKARYIGKVAIQKSMMDVVKAISYTGYTHETDPHKPPNIPSPMTNMTAWMGHVQNDRYNGKPNVAIVDKRFDWEEHVGQTNQKLPLFNHWNDMGKYTLSDKNWKVVHNSSGIKGDGKITRALLGTKSIIKSVSVTPMADKGTRTVWWNTNTIINSHLTRYLVFDGLYLVYVSNTNDVSHTIQSKWTYAKMLTHFLIGDHVFKFSRGVLNFVDVNQMYIKNLVQQQKYVYYSFPRRSDHKFQAKGFRGGGFKLSYVNGKLKIEKFKDGEWSKINIKTNVNIPIFTQLNTA